LPDNLSFSAVATVDNHLGASFNTSGGVLQVTLDPESAVLLATGPVDLKPPDPPTGLNRNAGASGEIELSWTASAGAAATTFTAAR